MLSKRLEEHIGESSLGESASCVEWCIKWKNLGYEFCTWEFADRTPLDSIQMRELIKSYEARSGRVRERNKSVKVYIITI